VKGQTNLNVSHLKIVLKGSAMCIMKHQFVQIVLCLTAFWGEVGGGGASVPSSPLPKPLVCTSLYCMPTIQ